MFGARKRLAEDLAHERDRNALLRQQLTGVTSECESWKWAAKKAMGSQEDVLIRRTRERDAAVRDLRETERQLGEARRGTAERAELLEAARDALEAAGQPGAHIDDWPAVAPGIQALATERDEQRQVIDRLTEQLFDAIGYQPAQRVLLGQEVTPA